MSTVTVKNVEINQPTLDEDGNTVIGGVVTIAFSPYAIITAGKAAKMTPSEMEEVARALFSHPDSIQHHVATELISEHIRVQHDHDRLVRELDVLINGENAAQQARLCDIVAQVRSEGLKAVPAAPAMKEVAWRHDDGPFAGAALTRAKSVADNWVSKGWKVTPLYELVEPGGNDGR